jgi:hypothetical protein
MFLSFGPLSKGKTQLKAKIVCETEIPLISGSRVIAHGQEGQLSQEPPPSQPAISILIRNIRPTL